MLASFNSPMNGAAQLQVQKGGKRDGKPVRTTRFGQSLAEANPDSGVLGTPGYKSNVQTPPHIPSALGYGMCLEMGIGPLSGKASPCFPQAQPTQTGYLRTHKTFCAWTSHPFRTTK